MPRLLVGLGNPGRRYQGTRHNVGYEAVDRILKVVGGRWGKPKEIQAGSAEVAEAEIEGQRVTLMKPLTYMNLSGGPVNEWSRVHSIERTDVLVYLDDVALPLGRLRLRERGSDGGHRGLASVLSALGGTDVPRVRIGIRPHEWGESGPAQELEGFVLSRFESEERPVVDEVLSRVVSATRLILSEGAGGMRKAMSLYNTALAGEGP